MKIKSEWSLIAQIKKITAVHSEKAGGLIIGIGDDCAVTEIGSSRLGLFTTDISIENVHFKPDYSSPEDIGYKAMTGNISDIYSMGGYPKLAFISLGIPQYINESFINSLYKGFIEAGKETELAIAGGDTSGAQELIINICLYGEITGEKPILRKNAQKGDTIFVTGTPGASKAGLEILQSGSKDLIDEFPELVKRHRRPEIRHDLIEVIRKRFNPTAMIDISDGLLSDLRHICSESRKGFQLIKKSIPLSEELKRYCRLTKKDPAQFALESGEEFELLFTSSKSAESIGKDTLTKYGISAIGTIGESGFCIITETGGKNINIKGYEHFKTIE